jgi:hypothetical protein
MWVRDLAVDEGTVPTDQAPPLGPRPPAELTASIFKSPEASASMHEVPLDVSPAER